MTEDMTDFEPDDVAVVGMAGRFPGAGDVGEFWSNLRGGVESIEVVGEEELAAAGVSSQVWGREGYVAAAPRFEGMDLFDAEFFGYSAREAQIMDPQHRVFLEEAWHALEDAGRDPSRFDGSIGVFAGAGTNRYVADLYARTDVVRRHGLTQVLVANELGFLATRVAYKLDLTGPALSLRTACSTSLVALHTARQSLLARECDMALAGGVFLDSSQQLGYQSFDGGFASLDGHVRPFDAGATGTVFGSGVGVVVLRRLADAVADGDRVLAVVRGSAVNNDGAGKVSFTAPSVGGQSRVVAAALADAGLVPGDVDYVEAHGTGTLVGDPIEVQALSRVFRGEPGQWGLGSLKGNVGHLDAAAGMAGLFKVVLALGHGVMPASVNFERANPDIDLVGGPFRVWSRARQWPRAERVRRAGVSAFGFGGTNAHVVVQEAPVPVVSSPSPRDGELVVLSARSPQALDRVSDQLADHLEDRFGLAGDRVDGDGAEGEGRDARATDTGTDPGTADAVASGAELADVAFTVAVGRRELPFRRVVSGGGAGEVVAALRSRDPGAVRDGRCEHDGVGVVFMFTGQGSQYAGMARELYACEAVFAEAFDRCVELVGDIDGVGLGEVVFAEAGSARAELLTQTRWTQPALFAVEYALARLWRSWGVEPVASVGHSLGEYVAACLAGVFSLEDAVAVVVRRGALMQQASAGAMVAVVASAEQVAAELAGMGAGGAGVDVAAVNGPEDCVVSGPVGAVELFVERARSLGWSTQALPGGHAFHSSVMDEVVPRLAEVVRGVRLSVPRSRFVSNVTGTWITDEQATSADYWAGHVRAGVRFADGVRAIAAEEGAKVFVEVGPGRTLTTLARRVLDGDRVQGGPVVGTVASLPHRQDHRTSTDAMRLALGQLWIHGHRPDWDSYFASETRHRVALPGYPFERRRHWLQTAAPVSAGETAGSLTGSTVHTGRGLSVRRAVLAPATHWPLQEHRLLGAPLVPGTYYLEMAVAAAGEHWDAPVGALADVEFLAPLVLTDDATRVVQLTLTDVSHERAQFEVSSADDEDAAPSAWSVHARGLVVRGPAEPRDRKDLAAMRQACGRAEVDVATAQQEHETMDFGPRWVESMSQVRVGDGEAMAEIALPASAASDVDDLTLHPAILDLATGFGGLVDVAGDDAQERGLHLPVGYESVEIHRRVPARVVSRMRLRDQVPGAHVRRYDVDVLDEEGVGVLTVRGFTARRVSDPEATVSRSRAGRRHHELAWVEAAPTTAARTGDDSPEDVVLLLGEGDDRTGFAQALAAAGPARTVRVPAPLLEEEPDDFSARCAEAASALADVDHVVVLLPEPSGGSVRAAEDARTACDAVYAVGHVLAAARPLPARLTVVGPQGDDVPSGPLVDPAVAAAFAAAQSVALENGVDLLCVASRGADEATIVRRVHGSRRPGQVLLREHDELVQELRTARLAPAPTEQELSSFLVTGGLGGLGLAVGLHLARTRPDVRIALVSRRELPPRETWAALADAGDGTCGDLVAMEGLCADLRIVRADVGDVAAMADAVAELREAWTDIDCVIHAAGVAGDGFVARKSLRRFRATLAPKLDGTAVLDEVLRAAAPRRTVLFGSTVSVFGAPGQSDYAAGNRFLEAFAATRTARGDDTVTIGWSDWLERGMAVDHDVEPDSGFFRSLPVVDALDSLDLLLSARAGSTTFVGELNLERLGSLSVQDWSAFLDDAPVRVSQEISSAVAGRRDEDAQAGGPAGAPAPAVAVTGRESGTYTPLETRVAELWGTELGLAEIDVTASTFELGGDSLTALRIATALEKKIGVRISMLDLLQYETVEELAAELERLGAGTDDEGGA